MDLLVMCIGNRDGGDDAVGPYIADHLKKSDIEVIDCGIIPENYTGVIKQKKPKTFIIIDAVEMGLKPGDIRIVPKDKIGLMHISTHGIPLSVLIKYLNQYVKKVILIGIQPERMSDNISDSVIKNADRLVDIIKNKDFSKINILK
jgi:hydrogenase 3 maturation protease